MRRELLLIAAACVGWFVLLVSPSTAYLLASLAYLAFLALLAWSALRPSNSGWLSGLLFVTLLALIPAWVMVGYWAYCLAIGTDP